MSAILALSAAHYISMRNNAVMNMINTNNARMNMMSNPTSFMGNTDSLNTCCAADTQLEIDATTSSIQYMYAKAMLEQIKKLQKENLKNLDIFG